jgi:hypothetical protein
MALVLAGIVGLVVGCGPLPWITRDPPEECGLMRGGEVIWAGRGDPVALGIVQPPPGEDLGTGEIWVIVAPPGGADDGFQPAFCYIPPPDEFGQGVVGGTVPDGWEPP